MILRRITEHVKAQNWFAVAIDFVIVVVGVFVGLQAQDWSKRQEDRRRETQIVADLLADLEIDRPLLAEGMVFAKRRVSAANAALVGAGLAPILFEAEAQTQGAAIVDYSFDVANGANLPATRPDRLWTDLALGFHPTPSTSTYDALIGAGDIRIIRDRNIVRQLQLYRNHTTTVEDQNRKMLSLREDLLRIGAVYGLAPFGDLPAEDYSALVAKERQLAASIRTMAVFAIYHHGELAAADARAAQLQAQLVAYREALQ